VIARFLVTGFWKNVRTTTAFRLLTLELNGKTYLFSQNSFKPKEIPKTTIKKQINKDYQQKYITYLEN